MGPASVPSFVTWPMRNTGTPVVFANACRRLAHSRTCVTEPAAAGAAGDAIVWIESTTIAAAAARPRRVEDRVEIRLREKEDARRRRRRAASARILTCCADSSALT